MQHRYPDLDSTLSGAVARFHRQHRIPGVAAGLVLGQDLVWSHAVGFADLAAGRPMTTTTRFRIASITKTLVATAIVQLADEGKLALDDAVVHHIPEFASARNPYAPIESVTLRGLLTHTSGLQEATPHAIGQDPEAVIGGLVPIDRTLARLDQVSIVIPPGSWKYSNLGYELLGEVVCRASGETLSGYLTRHLLDPLAMGDTTFDPGPDPAPDCAVGYLDNQYEDVAPPAPVWGEDWNRASGGLWSNVPDLARWVSQQFRIAAGLRRGPGQVLDGPSLARMQQPTVLKDRSFTYAQGLGWASLRRGDLAVVSHSGGLPGWRTNILFRPEDRLGVIVLLNSHDDAPGLGLDLAEIAWPSARDASADAGGVPRPEPCPPGMSAYLGSYSAAVWGSMIRIEWRDGSLVAVSRPVLSPALTSDVLVPVGEPDRFRTPEGACPGEEVRFMRDGSGRIMSLVLGGQAHFRQGVGTTGASEA